MPYWRLYYHIVWPTVQREQMICPEIESKVHEAIKRKAEALQGEVFAIGGTEDHVHIAVSIPPTIAISKFVGELKGSSSFYINHLRDNPHNIDWQRGYGIVSFRKENLEQVVEYILRQREHHKCNNTWPTPENYD